MADLFALLVQSGYSLGAQTAVLNTAGNNIANANTPGYSRQIANLVANPAIASMGSQAVGLGVSLQSVTQARDQFIERQMPNALATSARSQAEADALTSLSALNPDLDGGLPSSLSAFYSALRTMSQNPGDLALRQSVISAGRTLAQTFNQTAGAIEETRNGLDAKISGTLNTINAAARSLAELNKQIQIAQTTGSIPNELYDQRQQAMDTLAELTGATPFTNQAGDISMALPGGASIVSDSRAAVLSLVPDGSNGGHVALQMTRADGSGPVALAGMSMGGTLGGLYNARDGALLTAANAIDTFAFDFGDRGQHRSSGRLRDGRARHDRPRFLHHPRDVRGRRVLDRGRTRRVAADPRMLAAASTAPAASGDNRNILALMATETQALASGDNPTATLQQIVGNFGLSTARATALASHDGAMTDHLKQLRDATSGVSLDEETINLTKAQRAYEALAKVIATTDAMLDTLMQLK